MSNECETTQVDSAEGIFTEEQRNYVNGVEESQLRNHLLHQLRLLDLMEVDRDRALRHLRARSNQVKKLNKELIELRKDKGE